MVGAHGVLNMWHLVLCLLLFQIYWGHGVYGLEAAAALYFGKHLSLLTLGECAMLAGIIPAPELLSPYREPSRGKKAQARTLRRMVEAGFLDTATAAAAVNEPLALGIESDGTSGPWRAPYFVSEVLYELYNKYGRDEVLLGGLQVSVL
jgi:penicillin-binding protein 1A